MSLFTWKSKVTGATPGTDETAMYVDPTTGRLASKDDAGVETVYGSGGGGGETNTASNVGVGSGVFRDKTGSNLNLRSVNAGTDVSVVENADDITVSNARVYGSFYDYAESLPITVNLTDTPTYKVTLNNASLPAGDYKVTVSYSWNRDLTTSDFVGLLEEDTGAGFVNVPSSDDGELHRQEPQDSGGAGGATGSDQKFGFTRVFRRTLSGQANYRLGFNSSNNGDEASMWDASIEIVRVA